MPRPSTLLEFKSKPLILLWLRNPSRLSFPLRSSQMLKRLTIFCKSSKAFRNHTLHYGRDHSSTAPRFWFYFSEEGPGKGPASKISDDVGRTGHLHKIYRPPNTVCNNNESVAMKFDRDYMHTRDYYGLFEFGKFFFKKGVLWGTPPPANFSFLLISMSYEDPTCQF